jgi:hypothetical protein
LLVEARRRFVADRVRLSNRLENALKSYFPQALQLAGESLTTPMACAFLQKWPTLEAVQKAGAQRLRKFYYGQHSRAEELIQQRLLLLAQAKPLTTDAAVVSAQSLLVKSVAHELAALPAILAEYDQQIATLFAAHADYGIWDSFPGAGAALAPRLAAAWGTQRDRFENSDAMSAYSGILRSSRPVARVSGSICVGLAPNSCAKPSTNSRAPRSPSVSGPSAITRCNSNGAKAAMPPFAPSPSNGNGSCGAAGTITCPTTTPNTSQVSNVITTNSTLESLPSSPHQPGYN